LITHSFAGAFAALFGHVPRCKPRGEASGLEYNNLARGCFKEFGGYSRGLASAWSRLNNNVAACGQARQESVDRKFHLN
jgi:hypothetical protein